MSESKDKSLKQSVQGSRFTRQKNTSVSQVRRSATLIDPAVVESDKNSDKVSVTNSKIEQPALIAIAPKAHDCLKRWVSVSQAGEFKQVIKDAVLRQGTKQEEKRLNKLRVQRKIQAQTDSQLCLMALNRVLDMSGELLAEAKQVKNPTRANQEKEIKKQVASVEEQIALNNYVTVKSTISTLLKRFGKDEMLQDKVKFYEFTLGLIEEYERENQTAAGLQGYIQKLSEFEISPENAVTNSQNLKAFKKDLTVAVNKENKKKEPNKDYLQTIANTDKIATLLSQLNAPKPELKESTGRRQSPERKPLQRKLTLDAALDHSAFLTELLEKSNQSREAFYKQLDALRRTKKKSQELPYSVLLKVYDGVQAHKKETSETNLYLKAATQLYSRKNYTAEVLEAQLKKLDEKYQENELLTSLKENIDSFTYSAQEKATATAEVELKKLQKQNEKLAKAVETLKSQVPEVQVVDKKKQREEKKARDAERLKLEKEEKEINRTLDSIVNACSEQKWKQAWTSVNVFHKKFEESAQPGMEKTMRCLLTMNGLLGQLEGLEGELAQFRKEWNTGKTALEKEISGLQAQIKESEEYQLFVKDLAENFSTEGYPLKKVFEDIRKSRKKVVQERYQVLTKLEQPLTAARAGKKPAPQANESKNVSLNLSALSADNDSGLRKEANDLIQLVERIQKGGEWWKFIPKNLKNSSFKPIYKLLEKYRQSERANRQHQMAEKLAKEDGQKYELQIKKLTSKIADLEFNLQSIRERSTSQLQDSTARKSSSSELRSSRRSARSRQKEGQKKQEMQKYIEQERNMLNKIEELQSEKSALEGRNRSLQQEISQAEQRESIYKKEYDSVRGSLEMEKLTMIERITELEGEVEISEGRKVEVESRLESELSYYREMHGQITAKLQAEKQKVEQLTHDNQKMFSQLHHSTTEEGEKKYVLDIDTEHVFDINLSGGGLKRVDRRGHHDEHAGDHHQEIEVLHRRIEELNLKIKSLEEERARIVQSEVNNAVKIQQQDFNIYLKQFESEILQKFYRQLLPKELQVVLARERQQWQVQLQELKIKFSRLEADYNLLTQQKVSSSAQVHGDYTQILQDKQREWNIRKDQEIRARIEEVQLHWMSILQGKQKSWRESSSPSKVNVQTISEVELLSLIRSERYSQVINTLLVEKQAIWQQERRVEWQRDKKAFAEEKVKENQQYYEDLVLPSKYIEWEKSKNTELEALKKKWEQETTQHWQRIIDQQILPAKIGEALQAKQAQITTLRTQITSMVSPNDEAVIEAWKQVHLQGLLQQQGNFAIQHFIDNQLPNILATEQAKWTSAHPQSPHQDIAAVLEHERLVWEQDKKEQIQAIQVHWERQMKELETHLQGQIIEEQEKLINLQKVGAHSADVSVVIREESLKWEREKSALIQSHQEQLLAQKMRLQTIIQNQQRMLKRLQGTSWQQQKTIIIQSHQSQLLAQKMRLEAIIHNLEDTIKRYENQNWQGEKARLIQSHQEQLLSQKMRYESLLQSQEGIIKRLESFGWQDQKAMLIESHQSQLLAQKMKLEAIIHTQQLALRGSHSVNWEQEKARLIQSHQSQLLAQKMRLESIIHSHEITIKNQHSLDWEKQKASLIESHQSQLLAQKMRLESIIHSHEITIKNSTNVNWQRQKASLIESHQSQLLAQKMRLQALIHNQEGIIQRLESKVRVFEQESILLRNQTQQVGPEFEAHLRGAWQQQWRQRQVQIEQFWRNLLEQKEREWSSNVERVGAITPQAEAQLRAVWKQRHDIEWRERQVQIQTYWQNLIREREQQWVQIEKIIQEKHQLQIRQIQHQHTHTHTHTNTHETVVIKEERERWEKEKEVIILNAIQHETAQLHNTINEHVQHIRALEDEREKWRVEHQRLQEELGILTIQLQKMGELRENELRIVWQKEQEVEWNNRQREIQNYWQGLIREKEQEWARHEQSLIERHQLQIKSASHQVPEANKEEIILVRIKEQRDRWEQEKILILKDQEGHFLAEIQQLQDRLQVQSSTFQAQKVQWQAQRRAMEQQIGQLRLQSEGSSELQTNLRTVWLQEQETEWKNREISIEQHWQSLLRDRETSWISEREAEWKSREAAIEQHWQGIIREKERQWQLKEQQKVTALDSSQHELQSRLRTEKLQLERQLSSRYQTEISTLKSQVTSMTMTIQQLTAKLEAAEGQLVVLETSRNEIASMAQTEAQKLGDQLAKSRAQSKDYEEMVKIIEKQKLEIKTQSGLSQDNEALRREIIQLQETNRSIESKHWNQINQQKVEFETHILKLTAECESLNSRLNEINLSRVSEADLDTIASLQRQIETLHATIRTKDDEINFLKKTIESVNKELKQAKERVVQEAEKRTAAERSISQLKAGKMELEYELKFLKEREESLVKKVDSKDQEILSLKAQIGSQNDGMERKLKNAMQALSTSQIKYTEVEALLTVKTKEAQSLQQQLDRQRYQVQKIMAGSHSSGHEVSELRRSLRSVQEHSDALSAEKNRNFDEINSLKLALSQATQREDELKREFDKLARSKLDVEVEKSRLEEQIRSLRSERNGFSSNLQENEKMVRVQAERVSHLQQELADWREMGSREADPAELELLNKINRDVAELAFVNRQLETKCMLLQNRNVITSFSSSVINYFLLVQKHTDALVNHLVREGYVSEIGEYHQFAADSYSLLAAGHVQAYFEQWEELLRHFFQRTIASREEELRSQADQLLKLRDEMNEVLERGIEADPDGNNELLEDYKAVFEDIKTLVREYRRTQDPEYIKLLCTSLGIRGEE